MKFTVLLRAIKKAFDLIIIPVWHLHVQSFCNTLISAVLNCIRDTVRLFRMSALLHRRSRTARRPSDRPSTPQHLGGTPFPHLSFPPPRHGWCLLRRPSRLTSHFQCGCCRYWPPTSSGPLWPWTWRSGLGKWDLCWGLSSCRSSQRAGGLWSDARTEPAGRTVAQVPPKSDTGLVINQTVKKK